MATAALGGRYMIRAWQALKARPSVPRIRRFYEGGFQHSMTRREAALILGVRYLLSLLLKYFLGYLHRGQIIVTSHYTLHSLP